MKFVEGRAHFHRHERAGLIAIVDEKNREKSATTSFYGALSASRTVNTSLTARFLPNGILHLLDPHRNRRLREV